MAGLQDASERFAQVSINTGLYIDYYLTLQLDMD
jgi:hypothetical protein